MQIQLYFPNSRNHLSNCSLAVLAKILGSSLIISSWWNKWNVLPFCNALRSSIFSQEFSVSFTRDTCFPGGGTHITRDTCFLGGGTHIIRDMCFPCGWTDISRDKCFLGREHISLGICVSQVEECISLGICVSQVGDHISLLICVSPVSYTHLTLPTKRIV